MKKLILTVETNKEKFEIAEKALLQRDIIIIMVSSMKEAIEELTTKKEYMLLVICAEDTKYLLWLPAVRELTIIPVFVMKSVYDETEEEKAIDLGADLLIARPETVGSSIAICRALIRRFIEYCPLSPFCEHAITVGKVYLCLDSRNVMVDGIKIRLTKADFDCLYVLMSRRGFVVEFETFYNRIWGDEIVENQRNALQAIIKRLRKKIKVNETVPNYIISVKDIGYMFIIG